MKFHSNSIIIDYFEILSIISQDYKIWLLVCETHTDIILLAINAGIIGIRLLDKIELPKFRSFS